MEKQTFWTKIKYWFSPRGNATWLGWRLFLWGSELTAEEYWKQIYEQEKALIESFPERKMQAEVESMSHWT